jgi:uncharacterized spore protein YtfJ
MARLRVRELHRGETLCIHAVESIDVQRVSSDNGCRLFARLEPVAVIVCDSDAVKAFDMAAEEIDFPGLRALVPELAAVTRVSMSAS